MTLITGTLTNSLRTITLPEFEVPVREETIENATDVMTLDADVYTDFISQKRRWTLQWDTLSEADYTLVRQMYDNQFTLFTYPTLSIPELDVNDVPVRVTINIKDVVSNCGEVSGFQITMRETAQMSAGS